MAWHCQDASSCLAAAAVSACWSPGGCSLIVKQCMLCYASCPAPVCLQDFNTWLQDSCLKSPAERQQRLANWARAPGARTAHPREEHLLPLMVIAGAAAGSSSSSNSDGSSRQADSSVLSRCAAGSAAAAGAEDIAGHVLWDGECMGVAVSAVGFGSVLDA